MTTTEKIGEHDIHPLCAAVPDIAPDQWPKFRDSIGKHGLKKKIVRWNGMVIGGRQRLRGCLETNTPPQFMEFAPKSKTASGIEAEIKLFIQIDDLDRRQLSKDEIAIAMARLYPPQERGRPSKRAENTAQENGPNEPFNRPPDAELANAAGTSHTTLKRARAMLKGCIPAIVKQVDGKQIAMNDAANLSDLSAKEQRLCLKEVLERRSHSLTAARSKLCCHRDGLSAKTDLHVFDLRIHVLGEGNLPAIRLLLERNPDVHHPKDGKTYETVVLSGGKPGKQVPAHRCAKCRGIMFESDADWHERKISSAGLCHRECPE